MVELGHAKDLDDPGAGWGVDDPAAARGRSDERDPVTGYGSFLDAAAPWHAALRTRAMR
jgi:hypothetical protein